MKPIDLDAARRAGEVEYTPLQMSRLLSYIISSGKAIGGALVVLILLILAATTMFYLSTKGDTDRLNEAVDQIIAARTEARHTTCARANQIREEAGTAAAKKARDFIDAQRAYTGSPPATGRLKAAEDAYIESQRRVTLEAYPMQDCSAKGVEAFYRNPPIDPYADTCVPDGMGLCVNATTSTTLEAR